MFCEYVHLRGGYVLLSKASYFTIYQAATEDCKYFKMSQYVDN